MVFKKKFINPSQNKCPDIIQQVTKLQDDCFRMIFYLVQELKIQY
jgi:hypothetical protein